MFWKVSTGVLTVVVLVMMFSTSRTENLTTCPDGCIPIDPNPCPYGYNIHPETRQCAP